MYCENCGHELRPNARFCTACGAPVSMPDPEREDVQLYTEQLDAAPTWQPAAPVYVRAEPQRPARSLHDVAHHVRAYLAMLFAVLSILLLFNNEWSIRWAEQKNEGLELSEFSRNW